MLYVVGKSKERAVIKIVVSPSAKEVIERVAGEYGMKEFAVASAIYEWFGEQDDIAQRAILGMMKGMEIDAAARFMERMARETGAVPAPFSKVVGKTGGKGSGRPPEAPADSPPPKPRGQSK